MNHDINTLLTLSPEDRLDIINRLWESIETDLENGIAVPIPDWHREELDRRDREEPDPGPGILWRDFVDQLENRRR